MSSRETQTHGSPPKAAPRLKEELARSPRQGRLKVDPDLGLQTALPVLAGTVWCDKEHRRVVGLQMIGSMSQIQDVPARPPAVCPDIIVTNRMDQLATALDSLRTAGPSHTLHLITSGATWEVLENLQDPKFGAGLALRSIALGQGVLHVGLSTARQGDVTAAPLFEGIRAGTLLRPEREHERTSEQSFSERLAATLEYAESLERALSQSATVNAQEDAKRDATIKSQAALIDRQAARYRALSESKLGRATIKYWNWRKKSHR